MAAGPNTFSPEIFEIDKDLLLKILEDFNEELCKQDLFASINIYGGCAMMLLGYDSRRSVDLDGVFTEISTGQVSDLLTKVVEKNNIERSFFDSSIGAIIGRYLKINEVINYASLSNLNINICTPEQLLAMKLFSARLSGIKHDMEDAHALCRDLKIKEKNELFGILEKYILPEEIFKQNNSPKRKNCIDNFINLLVERLK